MMEYPILFSAPMVCAILAGHKTQTRRIVKPQPESSMVCGLTARAYWGDGLSRWWCPYGTIGNKLWVGETFRHWGNSYCGGITTAHVNYLADRSNRTITLENPPVRKDWTKNQPSISMPRWASRITLEITGVRVERLRDISHEDALAEGVTYDVSKEDGAPLQRYKQLWEFINGNGSWAKNPWVWVVEFLPGGTERAK